MNNFKNVIKEHPVVMVVVILLAAGVGTYFVAFGKSECEQMCGDGNEVLHCSKDADPYVLGAGCVIGNQVCLRLKTASGNVFDQMCLPKSRVNLAKARSQKSL